MKNVKIVTLLLQVFAVVSVLFGIYQYFQNPSFFDELVAEDSFYENLTALFLFLGSAAMFFILIKFGKNKNFWWKAGVFLFAIALFFGAGEEISWGQRIFGIQSSEYFKQHNAQAETNLHNMVVDGVKLNKLIFSNLMSIAFGIYFLVVPFLYRNAGLKKIINRFGVPVPRLPQVLVFVIITLIILLPLQHERKWEIWEYVFALTMFIIILDPENTDRRQLPDS